MAGRPDALSRGMKQRLGNSTRIGAADRLALRFDRRGDGPRFGQPPAEHRADESNDEIRRGVVVIVDESWR
jgi:hypothetical protein